MTAQSSSENLLQPTGDPILAASLPEIRVMLKIINGIGMINLLIGLPSVVLVLSLRSLSLAFTGLLSILTFWLLRMIARHISQTRSWTEFGVLAMCGVYFPSFILWLSSISLLDAILR
jgi:hypothetical protein